MNITVEDCGVIPYRQAHARQMELVELLHRDETREATCLILEHPPVFTLGRNGSPGHVSVDESYLKQRNIELVRVERGGEVTYHGPGQLVCYPVVSLRRIGLSVAEFVHHLEEIMLGLARSHAIAAQRDPRNHGIWVAGRKLGSIGIAIRHGITYHGLAINVNPDLEPFSWINPCGLSGVSMTSMQRELQAPVDSNRVKGELVEEIGRVFGCTTTVVAPASGPEPSGVSPGSEPGGSRGQTVRTAKPKWLKKRLPSGDGFEKTRRLVSTSGLHTVCQEARCPNQFECYGKGTATFMIMGETCTRNCRFCAVSHAPVEPLDPSEPQRIASAAADMGLDYVVLTSVTRDDLPDGGAAHFVSTMQAIKARRPGTLIEILIPDLQGNEKALAVLCREQPAVLNHNIETVPSLYPRVRPQALYHRSLQLLATAKSLNPAIVTKSGLMVGLGESREELIRTMGDIREAGCDLLTLGQYLQPTKAHLAVKRFVPPEEFEELRGIASELGFKGVAAGPHVRSSYRAGHLYETALQPRAAAAPAR